MIPILYERDEIAFVSNGLGRLRDCISCVVTEERNGIFECDFDYPVDGANYELIELGRIIGVTYDESETIEPFDIVSFTKPIDGIVSFHAVHISYRLSAVTVAGKNINSLAAALSLLEQGTPSNPFTYYTDKTSSAYMAAADGTPRSVRQLLGGVEGSILDTYGGEYKFERFQVSLLTSRGEIKPFTVRYGVNLIEYNDDTDASGTFTSCIPYWTDGTTTVIGNKVTSSGVSFDGRERCVPYDLSEKFETAPTKTQLQNLAAQEMNRLQSWLPAQTISVDFARLSDFSEFASFESLYECNLCDSITVIFPDYGTSGVFKIVKTTWNVLADRYDGMELGTLSTTLGDLFADYSLSKEGSAVPETTVETVTLTSQFEPYTSAGALRLFKNGNIVNLRGQLKPTSTLAAGATATIGTVPEAYRPSIEYACGVMQGSGHARWWCQVRLDGTIGFERYADSTGAIAVKPSNWLPIDLTWIIGA